MCVCVCVFARMRMCAFEYHASMSTLTYRDSLPLPEIIRQMAPHWAAQMIPSNDDDSFGRDRALAVEEKKQI